MRFVIPRKTLPKLTALWLCGLTVMGTGGLALAQRSAMSANVVPELSAFKVSVAAGAEKLVSAARIMPGETLEYQVRYLNSGGRGATNLQAVLPIPAALEYVSGSASPPDAQASVNGKTYAPMPLTRIVKAADGTQKTVPIPTSEYRFLRWKVALLGPGQAVRVSARAQLAGLVKAEPQAKPAKTTQ